MKAGDITVHRVAQPDGSFKVRPVLLLRRMQPFGDWMVCAISTQLRQEVHGFDIVMPDTAPSFKSTGLKGASLIRLGFINTVSKTALPGPIGGLEAKTIKLLQQRLANYLVK